MITPNLKYHEIPNIDPYVNVLIGYKRPPYLWEQPLVKIVAFFNQWDLQKMLMISGNTSNCKCCCCCCCCCRRRRRCSNFGHYSSEFIIKMFTWHPKACCGSHINVINLQRRGTWCNLTIVYIIYTYKIYISVDQTVTLRVILTDISGYSWYIVDHLYC